MAKIIPAAPLDGPAVLPDVLIDQYVKPGVNRAALIDALRLTAVGWVEQHTARSLARRPWMAVFDGFGSGMLLPRDPVRSVVSLGYIDATGATVDGVGLWRLAGSQILPAIGGQWPSARTCGGAVTVIFEAGYDDVASEAPGLQIAALMLVKHLFDGGSLDDVPATVSLLIDEPYRTPVMG